MATGMGSKGFMAFKTESTYGTPVAPSAGQYNRFKRCTVKNRGAQTSGNRNLGIPWASAQRVHQKRAAGEIAFDASYQGHERFWLHIMGAASASNVVQGSTDEKVGITTYTPKIAQQVGGTLEVHADLVKMIYPGGRLTQCRFNFRKNDPLEVILQYLGLPHTDDTPDAAATGVTFYEETPSSGCNSIPCINPIEQNSKGFKFEIGTAGGSGYATVGIIEGDFTIDKPHVDDRGNIGSAVIAEPIPNGEPIMTFTGNIRKEFLDSTFIAGFVLGEQKAFRWTYEGNVIVDATAGTLYYKWVLEAPYVRWLESPPEIANSGPIEDNLPFICESPDGTTSPITLVTTNGIIVTPT